MRQPQGRLPGVDPKAALLVRVPVYDLRDYGRGFWVKVDKDAKEVSLKTSKMFPAFCFHRTGDVVDLVMTTHVDDFRTLHGQATFKVRSRHPRGG